MSVEEKDEEDTWEKEEPELDAREKRERLDRIWEEACKRSDRGRTI